MKFIPVLSIFLACTCSAVEITNESSMEKANRLYRENNYSSALKQYEAILTKQPKEMAAYLNAAVLDKDLGYPEKAYSLLQKASTLEKNNPILTQEVAWLAYLIGEKKSAKQYAEKTLSIAPSALSLFILGLLDQEEKKWESPIPLLRRLTIEFPFFTPGLYALGRSYENTGSLEEAEAMYLRTLKADYTLLEARLARARILEKKNRKEEADKEYARILQVDPQQPEALARAQKFSAARSKIVWNKQILALLKREGLALPLPKQRDRIPRLKIGLGTTPGGNLTKKSGVLFRTYEPFRIYRKKSRQTIVRGQAGENWALRMSTQSGVALEVVQPDGALAGKFQEPIVLETDKSVHIIVLHSVPYGQGFAWAGASDRGYRGRIEFLPNERFGIETINDVNLEEYLYSVLSSEMPSHWPLEALKTQAVIARSAAYYKQRYEKPHRKAGYDLCDDQHCQVYSGLASEKPIARQAVDETRAQLLTYHKRVIHALYHSNCGGQTHAAKELASWWGEPYLEGVWDARGAQPESPWQRERWIKESPSAHCSPSEVVTTNSFRWIKMVSRADLEERINRSYPIGELKKILTLKRSSAGYITQLKFLGSKKDLILQKEHELRHILALGQIRSTLAVLDINYTPEGKPKNIFIFGGGWGHGVGLCQSGAANLAFLEKMDYRKILNHYYPKAKLEILKEY